MGNSKGPGDSPLADNDSVSTLPELQRSESFLGRLLQRIRGFFAWLTRLGRPVDPAVMPPLIDEDGEEDSTARFSPTAAAAIKAEVDDGPVESRAILEPPPAPREHVAIATGQSQTPASSAAPGAAWDLPSGVELIEAESDPVSEPPGKSPPSAAQRAEPAAGQGSGTGSPGDVTDITLDQSGKDPFIGREIEGRYRIVSRIGDGGMGVVYKATQKAVDRTVAVKVLPHRMITDATIPRRFEREARSASQLLHPNTITIHDFGQTRDGVFYIVMEYLNGCSLSEELKSGGFFSWRRALRIVSQICGSLAEAHDKGIVHRDIKPGNIFLLDIKGREDFVKVLDFGIAKLLDASSSKDDELTQEGVIVGSARYMSPEQIRGQDLDPCSDVYSLGVVAYEMLVQRPITRVDNRAQYYLFHLYELPKPFSEARPDLEIPASVEAMVTRMLAKDPSIRYQSAGELADACDALLASTDLVDGEEPSPDHSTKSSSPSSEWTGPSARSRSSESNGASHPGRERTLERLLNEIDAFLASGLAASAVDHLRTVLTRDPDNDKAIRLACAINGRIDEYDLADDEREWLGKFAAVHAPAESIKDRSTLSLRPTAAIDMVRIGSCRFESVWGGEIHTDGFLIDRYPITNKQYAKFVRATRETAPGGWLGSKPRPSDLKHPVVGVTMEQAERYAQWRGVRLPTDVEWEIAARGPDGRAFPWGDEWDPARCQCRERKATGTSPIDAHPQGASADGCEDLIGNVCEWTVLTSKTRPLDEGHVWVMGGSYHLACVQDGHIVRSSVWTRKSYPHLGFRCAADDEER